MFKGSNQSHIIFLVYSINIQVVFVFSYLNCAGKIAFSHKQFIPTEEINLLAELVNALFKEVGKGDSITAKMKLNYLIHYL